MIHDQPPEDWWVSAPSWMVAVFTILGGALGAVWRSGGVSKTVADLERRVVSLEEDRVTRADIAELKELIREVRTRVDRIVDSPLMKGRD